MKKKIQNKEIQQLGSTWNEKKNKTYLVNVSTKVQKHRFRKLASLGYIHLVHLRMIQDLKQQPVQEAKISVSMLISAASA
jgi:6-phosphogluconate dehydrogenase